MSIINIINDDNMVVIDGDAEDVIFTGNPNIHAIHWDDVALIGEVEYKNKSNEVITDFTPYDHFLGDHGNSKAARLAAEAADKQQEDDDRDAENVANEAAAEAALTQQDRRYRAYPDINEQLYALHQARQGDSTAITAIDAAIAAVDVQFPL